MRALHGREPEVGAIAGALDAVARGGRRLLIVRGEPGIGKTRLLAEAGGRAAAQRFAVLDGRGTELERDVPFGALSPALSEPVSGGAAAERWRAHRAIAGRLAELAGGRPLLLLVDDAHWADPATLELLEHVLRRPPADPLLLAVGLRPGPAAERLLAARAASGAFELVALELRPLAREAAEALLAGVPAGAERERCFAQSGGNPLLLEELARDGGAHALPGGVVAAVRAEVAALPADARALAHAAAVAGDPFGIDLAAAIAGLDQPRALAALDAAEHHDLVRATADPRVFAFRHPVVRTAIYESLGAGARLAQHAAAARALAHAPPPIQARHLLHAATPGDTAAAATLRAAAATVRPQAPDVAAGWLLAADRADPSTGDPIVTGRTLVEAGRLDDALAVAGSAPGPAAAVLAASIERLLGRHAACRARLLRALDAVQPGGAEASRVLADLAVAAYQRGEYAEMAGWAQRVEAAGDDATQATAATLLAVGRSFAGERDAAAVAAATALAALARATDAELAAVAEPAMAIPWGLLALDRLPEGLVAARRIAAAAHAAGHGLAAITHDIAAVLALGLLGRLEEAEAGADETEQAARVSGNPQLLQWVLWLRAWVLMERGRLDLAHAAARESAELADGLDDSASAIVARTVLGAVLAAREQHERARELLRAYDIDNGWICRWAPVLVTSDLALGDLAGARADAGRAAALAPATGMAGARAAAGRAEALVALAEGDAPLAARLALSALDEAEAAGAALEAARSRLVAGRALLTSDRAAGLALLGQAAEEAARCGAPRVADEARLALRRAGVRIGRGGGRAEGATGLAALSGREREVADLVSEGLTNREIGARLFLSEKTIETHMTRVLQKLGVRSRAQVAAEVALGAHGRNRP